MAVYSHPPGDSKGGVLLTEHLADVAARVENIVPTDAKTPTGESLRAVVETLAYVHDFGKATTFFQEYLLNDRSPDPEELRYHAPLGSLAAYYALETQEFDTETCLAGFVAVAKHHGQLPDVADYVHTQASRSGSTASGTSDSVERRQQAVAKQIANIGEQVPELAVEVVDDATVGQGSWESFYEEFTESFRDGSDGLLDRIAESVATTGTVPGVNRDALSESCYGLVLQCWSALILADKTSAAGVSNESEVYTAEQPSLERLDEYVRTLEANTSAAPDGTRSERLNHYRSRAREAVLDNTASVVASDSSVATLTLPTGMGKTLTGLSAALDIRDQCAGERVIYALPFTSIIDQVVEEAGEIYETDITGRLLTAHHHLSETVIRDDGDDEKADRNDDIAGMLAESWRAGLTVTTFVQLFESLAGPGNRQSMKLPALRNSVIILDEPQSLPLDWWKLVRRLVNLLTEQYGATVIAMTATQPELFDEATKLVDDPDVYFDAVERVRYRLDQSTERYIADQTEPKSYDAAAATLLDAFDSESSILAVCNTIDSTRELTKRVRESDEWTDVGNAYAVELDDAGTVDATEPEDIADRVVADGRNAILHLSTRLRPADRLTLIGVAKRLTDRDHPMIAVSTQLVEAGVDISFDHVYRDLAPIDSIVQAAGRCNRSFERERGQVTIWWIEAPDEQETTPAEAVYNRGPSLLPVAAATLKSVREGDETLSEVSVARDAVTTYYERLRKDKDVGEQAYADYVDEARGDALGELSLIDQRRAADVFVSRTKEERVLAEEIRKAHTECDFETVRSLLDETKPLRVSVPYYREDSDMADAITDLPTLIDDEGIYHLDVRDYNSYFDETTGFVVPENTVTNQFL